MSIDRYKAVITAALEIQSLRNKINQNISIISKNLTVHELLSRSFDDSSAVSAIKTIDNVEFKDSQFVECTLVYKGIEINLHCSPKKSGSLAMKKILEEIKTSDIR